MPLPPRARGDHADDRRRARRDGQARETGEVLKLARPRTKLVEIDAVVNGARARARSDAPSVILHGAGIREDEAPAREQGKGMAAHRTRASEIAKVNDAWQLGDGKRHQEVRLHAVGVHDAGAKL